MIVIFITALQTKVSLQNGIFCLCSWREAQRYFVVFEPFNLCNLPFRTPTLTGHFTVVCLVAWHMNASEARGDLVLIQTYLVFSFKWTTWHKNNLIYITKVVSSLSKQGPFSFESITGKNSL